MKQFKPNQKGLLTGILMILASLFSLYVLKNPIRSNFEFLIYSIFCFGILWSLVSYFRNNNDKKTFINYFSVGFQTFVVATLLMAVFTFVYFFTHPEFRDNNIAENSRLLLLQGNHFPKEIEENAKELKKWFLTLMVSIDVFKYLFIGALISAIIAGFLSKKKTTV